MAWYDTHPEPLKTCFVQPLHNVQSTQLSKGWSVTNDPYTNIQKYPMAKGGQSWKVSSQVLIGPNLPHIPKSECNQRPLTNIRITGLRHGYGGHRVTPKTYPWSRSEYYATDTSQGYGEYLAYTHVLINTPLTPIPNLCYFWTMSRQLTSNTQLMLLLDQG